MPDTVEGLLRRSPLYRRLSAGDLQRLATVARLKSFRKGDTLFSEGDPSDFFFTVVSGRVKVVKLLPSGKEIILEIFGEGDPLGAVAAYEGWPYPASAVAIEDASCILLGRAALFALLETHPSLVRGLLVGLTHRLVELTNRIAEMTGSRVEQRFAHLFLKLADRMGEGRGRATFIALPLSRQELADLAGTTIETAIRVMSRWGKEGVLTTEKEGFLLQDRGALEKLVMG